MRADLSPNEALSQGGRGRVFGALHGRSFFAYLLHHGPYVGNLYNARFHRLVRNYGEL